MHFSSLLLIRVCDYWLYSRQGLSIQYMGFRLKVSSQENLIYYPQRQSALRGKPNLTLLIIITLYRWNLILVILY